MDSDDDLDILEEKPIDFLGEAYCEDIRPFIDIIDNMRKLGLQQDVNLPNVVVVGDQSSGKSSIIEAISGIQLPRGKGIVTRCPLELQLNRVIGKPWKATLTYKTLEGVSKNVEIYERFEVDESIRIAQEEMCGSSKGVSRNLITLRVESPAKTAPDLTLIDLPGIARIAVEGQPRDICEQIKTIIMEHVENVNTVILCVVSANLDAAVNESIKIAQEVDPEGKRTIGVITKPDMADEANKEDVLCLLNNEKVKLDKGYHMVKCRSQKDLDDNLTLEDSLKNEEKYFESDKYYRKANKTLIGTKNLSFKITEQLVQVIQNTLPELRDKITTSLEESQKRILSLPPGIPENNQEKKIYLIGVIGDLNNEIKFSLIKGKCSLEINNLFHVWRKEFNYFRSQMDSITENAMMERFTIHGLTEEMLQKRGNEISGFLNFELFEALITDHIPLFKTKAELLLKQMTKNSDNLLKKIIQKYFEHLPAICSHLMGIADNQIEKANKKALEKINNIFEEEKLVFTLDSAFEREVDQLEAQMAQNSNIIVTQLYNKNGNKISNQPIFQSSESNTTKNANRMLTIIKSYLKIVHSRLSDLIPMSIRQCLHVELATSLKDMFIKFGMSDGVEIHVRTNKRLNEERKNLNEKIDRLKQARELCHSFSLSTY